MECWMVGLTGFLGGAASVVLVLVWHAHKHGLFKIMLPK
jgi:hypothetical protein